MNEFNGYYRVLFDGHPATPTGETRFIELEDKFRRGVGPAGGSEWVIQTASYDDDGKYIPGHVELHIPAHPAMRVMHEALKEIQHRVTTPWIQSIADNALERVALIEEGEELWLAIFH